MHAFDQCIGRQHQLRVRRHRQQRRIVADPEHHVVARRAQPAEKAFDQLRFGRGYDHNWVVSRKEVAAPRMMARVEDPESGRVMEVWAKDPGLQFYSGNFLDGTITGKSGHIYREGDAIVLEPQMFPDTPNQPAFGSIRLAPGQAYDNKISFRFSTAAR